MDVPSTSSRQIMNRNGANVSPYMIQVTMSKKSMSLIGEQTIAFVSL